ncbi:uncharacterized protein [Drosophila tropicalis]|uniref:uncharacterized protein n=1 Tax=Drosophila tropicalis TaxID=46794 RepID=UPI0035ABBE33
MAISSPIPTSPIPTPPPAAAAAPSLPVVSLSIDPIALQFPSKSRSALKRNNSYRLANDDLKLEMNKENNNNNTSYTLDPNQSALPPSMQYATGSLKLSHRHNVATPNGSGNGNGSVCGSGGERRIAKSFERLVDEFSLSLTTGNDSSYLKNKSLENFDDSPALATVADEQETKSGSDTDSDSDDDSEMTATKPPMSIKYQKSFVENILLRPFKIILPNEDNGGRRQRILQKFEVTEIW